MTKDLAVAIVGSRKCTPYGSAVAKEIARKAVEHGITVVSGLARGIDTISHKAALESGGRTIAVLGGGTDVYYPAENKGLQMKIGESHLLLSEHPPQYKPKPFDFPKRNRIISALAESVIVTEAPDRSGSLITAECAEEQGKNVYAVPGNITSHYSFGTNKLIREGAMPLVLIDDIFVDLGINPYLQKQRYVNLGKDEKKILQVLMDRGEVTMEQLVYHTKMKPGEISSILTIMEMKGLIFSSVGKFFVANYE